MYSELFAVEVCCIPSAMGQNTGNSKDSSLPPSFGSSVRVFRNYFLWFEEFSATGHNLEYSPYIKG